MKDHRDEHADGIRVEENGGWAQFVPDPDEPLFHIYAEGPTDGESAELAQRYRALLDEVCSRAPSASTLNLWLTLGAAAL